MKWKTLQFATLLMTVRMHIITMPLLLRANVICWERQTLELNFFFSRPFRSMWNIRVCVSCSSWGVEVYANEIITIHLALSNLGKRRSATCIQVLFYNLHGWRAHHKSCSEEERELQKRPNEWMNECGKCIVRILCVCVMFGSNGSTRVERHGTKHVFP